MTRDSLEGRLLRRLVAAVGGALVVAGFVLAALVEVRVRGDFDRLLEDRARALASLAEQEDGRVWLEFEPAEHPEFLPGAGSDAFELRDAGGVAIAGSAPPGSDVLGVASLAAGVRDPSFVDLSLPDGRAGRAVIVRFVPREEEPEEGESPASPRAAAFADSSPVEAEVVLARDRGTLDRFVDRLRTTTAAVVALLLGGVALLIGWTLRGELARLRALGDRIAAVDAGSLGRPMGDVSLPAELRPLVARIESLRERLHASFERERDFSRQLAHELRTPLAELRTTTEVARRWPTPAVGSAGAEEGGDVSETLREIGEIGAQMERLLEHLLALARADAGIEGLVPVEVDLRQALDRLLRELAGRLSARGIEVRADLPPGATVRAPEAVVGIVLRNLVANAADHADASSWVEIAWDGALDRLTARNPARDLAPADLPLLFERFWRKRPERSLGEHAGLGLALVRELARGAGGDATAELVDGALTIAVTGLAGSSRGSERGFRLPTP